MEGADRTKNNNITKEGLQGGEEGDLTIRSGKEGMGWGSGVSV